ncbi:MAG TPA: cytochrome c maturation protein CcmE, partial [Chromatiales bacterium]|nr:cytochrome c maturation protein CcmE [Chromatiales bacterium]
VGLILAGVALAVGLALQAFRQNMLFFYSPSQVQAGEAPAGREFRLGGLVEKGSMHREEGQLEVRFEVTDNNSHMTVYYNGVLPDLFREGQGVIAKGSLQADGSFRATEVLAKHDENYMPPEVADMLAEQGHPGPAGSAETAAN